MSSKNYYVNGNTVRELDTPVRHNQRTRKEIEEARRRKNRRNAARAVGMWYFSQSVLWSVR